VVIWYDVKASGEDAKRPAHQRAAFRKNHLDRMMAMTLESRSAPNSDGLAELPKREVVLLFDACREGNMNGLLSSIKVGDKALTADIN
jgi:hypothetical protein